MPIRWDKDHFKPLKLLHGWDLPSYGGVYVIVGIRDSDDDRRQKILYVGETKNFSDRVTQNHEKYDCWVENSHGMTLYVSTHMENDEAVRKRKESELIRSLSELPPCNELI